MSDIAENGGLRPRPLSAVEWQLELTRRETSNLVRHEDGAILASFLDLCRRTLEWLPRGLQQPFSLDPASASCGVLRSRLWDDVRPIRADLVDEWHSWPQQYRSLIDSNPRLAIADCMSWISECIDASSWPTGLEQVLVAWVESGIRLPLPFQLWTGSADELDDAFYLRLSELRQQARGWCWYDDVAGMVVFRPDQGGPGDAS